MNRRRPSPLLVLEVGLLVCLVGRLLWRIHQPFNYDDQDQIFSHLSHFWLPHYVLNHFIARTLSGWSMDLFGPEKWAIRLPSLLMSFLFLGALWRVTAAPNYRPARALLLLNFFFNEFVLWALLSPRGYSSILALLTTLFAVLQSKHPRKNIFVALLVLLTPFTHFVAIAYVIPLLCAYALRYALLSLFFVAFIAWQSSILLKASYVLQATTHFSLRHVMTEFTHVLGFNWDGWAVALLGWLGIGFRSAFRSFPFRYTALVAGLFSGATFLFSPAQFHVRFLLPLLVFFVLASVETMRASRVAYVSLLLVLTVPAAFDAAKIRQSQLIYWPVVERFFDELPRATDHASARCINFKCKAQGDFTGFCRHVMPRYFVPTQAAPDACSQRYVVELNPNPVARPWRADRFLLSEAEWLRLFPVPEPGPQSLASAR